MYQTSQLHLNFSAYIAKRVAVSNKKSFSGFITKLSITATALSVATTIIAFAILYGFEDTVASKVFGFWGHVRVKNYEQAKSSIAEDTYIDRSQQVEALVRNTPNVRSINAYALKSAILSGKTEFDGLLMKGIERNFDTTSFTKFLKKGRWIAYNDTTFSKEIMLSQTVAELLKVNINDKLIVYCFDSESEKTRAKNVTVVGIYKTEIEEYDKQFFMCDLNLIRDLNFWDSTQIGGYEIYLNDIKQLETTSKLIHENIPEQWQAKTIKEEFPNIFDWLTLLDKNKYVFLIVMGTVAIVNLITCLIILVLERIKMIGILKALGSSNKSIRSVFVYHTAFITITGIVLGTALGVGLCYLQLQTGWLKLSNAETYSVSTVPVLLKWQHVLGIGGGTLLVSIIILIIPSLIINKISPVKAIRFD